MAKGASRDLDIVDFFVKTGNVPANRSTIAKEVKRKLVLKKFAAGSLQYQLNPLITGTLAFRGIVRIKERIEGPLYDLDPARENVINVLHEYYIPNDSRPCHLQPDQLTPRRVAMFFKSTFSAPLFTPDNYFLGFALARYLNDWSTGELEKLSRRLQRMHDPRLKGLAQLADRICRYCQLRDRPQRDLHNVMTKVLADKFGAAFKEANEAGVEEIKSGMGIDEDGRETKKDDKTAMIWRQRREAAERQMHETIRPADDVFHYNFAFIGERLELERDARRIMSRSSRRIMISDEHFKKLNGIMKISPTFLSYISSPTPFFRGDRLDTHGKHIDLIHQDSIVLKTLRKDFTRVIANTLVHLAYSDRFLHPELLDDEDVKRAGFLTLSDMFDYLDGLRA